MKEVRPPRRTKATIEAAATWTRMGLSATSAGLALNLAASPRRVEHGQGSVSSTLFELKGIPALTTFPVSKRAGH